DIEKCAISMGPISRQDIECSTNPKGDLERLVKLATRHEYHHAVFDANVKKDPKLPEKILSVVDSEEKLKASWNLFARYMFDSPIYRLTLFDKNGNQNRLGILHEIFAYAGEFKYSVPGNPHENFIGVAYRFLNTMESCNPELLNYLKYLDIVDNTTFDEDYPEIRKVLSTMAKKFSGFGPIQSFGRA
ncbi:MAG TPA: hypothetical protein VF189_03410, partial [Patescibacteria group bacterium]